LPLSSTRQLSCDRIGNDEGLLVVPPVTLTLEVARVYAGSRAPVGGAAIIDAALDMLRPRTVGMGTDGPSLEAAH